MLTQQQIIAKYGQPGDEDNLTTINLPFPMRIAWDVKTTVTKMRCHKAIASPLISVFSELLSVYGLPKLQQLGIDLFGGCYNFRKMRGGSSWSRHSWGIAIDLDPARNGLKTKKPTAQFSKLEYKQMINIFYKHGFIGYGPEKDYDWMHFEINQ